jgi:predicted PurR-regulated permease PerM
MLVALTAIALFLCWQMVAPFLPAFAWALALAVAVHPLRSRLMARLPRTPAAILTVFIALVVLAVPGILLVHELIVRRGGSSCDICVSAGIYGR